MAKAIPMPEMKDTKFTNPAPKEEQKSTIAVLDGVRAFACVAVIVYHINYLTLKSNIWNFGSKGSLHRFIADLAIAGSSGVTLFFILSGFLLFMTYARSMLYDKPWPEMKRFYLRRIFRIWPGYYVSLVLLILLVYHQYLQNDHLKQDLLFVTFFMDSSKSTFEAINGPFWTLAVEWQFYMLLPLLALGMRWIVQRGSLQRRLLLLLMCVGAIIAWGVATRWWGYSWTANPHRPMFLPAPLHNIALFFLYGQNGKYLEDFAIGMLICALYTFIRYTPEHVVSRIFCRYIRFFWILGIVGLLFAALWYETPWVNTLTRFLGPHRSLSEIPYAAGYGLCVFALLLGPRDLRWFWELYPVRWIGLLSYGLYIWHLPLIVFFLLNIVPALVSHGMSHFMIYAGYWVWAIVIVLPFGYIFNRIVEKPWITIGGYVTSKKLPTS